MFEMEKLDSENFRKGQPYAKFFNSKIYLCENYLQKNAGMNESTVLPWRHVHARALLVFLSRHFGTGVEMRRTFHCHLAVCIETTHLSHKDCFAGYRYKKTAVINVHYALNSLHTLWSSWNEGLLYVEYRNC